MLTKLFLSIITFIISIILIYVTFYNYKSKLITFFEFLFWSFCWLAVIFIAVRPKFFDIVISEYLGLSLSYIINVMAIIFLVIIAFKTYLKNKLIEKKLDKLIRSEALHKIYKDIDK